MTGEQVTAKEITDDYDTEEMEALIDAYMEFAGGVRITQTKDPLLSRRG